MQKDIAKSQIICHQNLLIFISLYFDRNPLHNNTWHLEIFTTCLEKNSYIKHSPSFPLVLQELDSL